MSGLSHPPLSVLSHISLTFGMLAPPDAITTLALIVSALSIAGAILLYPGTGPALWRPDSDLQPTDAERLEPTHEMRRMRIPIRRLIQVTALGLTPLGGSGCQPIGPGSILRDLFDYCASLADSWKSMMLLNIVKTRYLDLAIFLDGGQVVSGYTLETVVSVNGRYAPPNRRGLRERALRGEGFWIANDNWKSKRTLTSIPFLLTLTDTGASQSLPTLTIPTR